MRVPRCPSLRHRPGREFGPSAMGWAAGGWGAFKKNPGKRISFMISKKNYVHGR